MCEKNIVTEEYRRHFNEAIEKLHREKAEEIERITTYGDLAAIDGDWEYWIYDGAVYSITVDRDINRFSVWCWMENLRAHLRDIYRYHQPQVIISPLFVI